ncbi:MAG: hypothetical protein ACI9IA_002536 [Enterobacterales bacterium]|jgi:hypothetical protein
MESSAPIGWTEASAYTAKGNKLFIMALANNLYIFIKK